MPIEVQMPQMGESVVEGTIAKWLVKEGDTVTEDQPLVEISTDKVDTEIPSPGAGKIAKLVAAGRTDPAGRRGHRPNRESWRGGAAGEACCAAARERPQTDAAAGGSDRARTARAGAGTGAEGASVGSSGEALVRLQPPGATAPTGGRSSAISPVVVRMVAEHGLDIDADSRHGNRRTRQQTRRAEVSRGAAPGRRRQRRPGAGCARACERHRSAATAPPRPAPDACEAGAIACAHGSDDRRISSAGLPAARGRHRRGVHAPAQAHRRAHGLFEDPFAARRHVGRGGPDQAGAPARGAQASIPGARGFRPHDACRLPLLRRSAR